MKLRGGAGDGSHGERAGWHPCARFRHQSGNQDGPAICVEARENGHQQAEAH